MTCVKQIKKINPRKHISCEASNKYKQKEMKLSKNYDLCFSALEWIDDALMIMKSGGLTSERKIVCQETNDKPRKSN